MKTIKEGALKEGVNLKELLNALKIDAKTIMRIKNWREDIK